MALIKTASFYHPNPRKGTAIGRAVTHIPNSDIYIAILNPGWRYINETFGNGSEFSGIRIPGICPDYPPHLRVYESLSMNNPFSGNCEGVTMALGGRMTGEGTTNFIKPE